MSSDRLDRLQGLAVRVRDGRTLGVVVGLFTEGPLAGRLRVQGDDASLRHPTGPQDGIAVYTIPRRAVAGQLRASQVLDTTQSAARARWLMHVVLWTEAARIAGPALALPFNQGLGFR